MQAILVSLCLANVSAHESYVALIPNGNNVTGYAAIGHNKPTGGGSRNAFGTHFGAVGKKWTTALCCADDDGDGFSNGAELGDPCCAWTPGGPLNRTVDITHPALASSVPTIPIPACARNPCKKATGLRGDA